MSLSPASPHVPVFLQLKPRQFAGLLSSLTLTLFSQDGFTGLYQAAQNGHLEVVELLLDKGADVNRTDKVKPTRTPATIHSRL